MSNTISALRNQANQVRQNIANIDAQIANLKARKTAEQRGLRVVERAEKQMLEVMDSMPPQPENVLVVTVELAVSDYRARTLSATEALNTIYKATREARKTLTQTSILCGKSAQWLYGITNKMEQEARRG